MFLPPDIKPSNAIRPLSSAIRQADWDVLADFWHPVALSSELGVEPISVRLLDVEVALFRDENSAVCATLDTCPHRHVRLSTGRVVDGQIECPFHGLRFRRDGQCMRVPALGDRGKLPSSYRVRVFAAKERYGLIWLCLGNAERNRIPDFEALDDADLSELSYNEPTVWPVSAPRQVENFFDLAHLPIAHAATLGGDPDAPIQPGKVEHTNDAVILRATTSIPYPDGRVRRDQLTYRVVLPFAVDFLSVSSERDGDIASCDVASPVSAYETKVFQVFRIDGDQAAREAMGAALVAVNNEDIALLRTVQMPDLPLDQHHEIHLPVDNMSHQYRSRLRDLGLGSDGR